MRSWLELGAAALLAAVLSGVVTHANAQTCHGIDVRPNEWQRYRLMLGASSASYNGDNGRGAYQGLHAGVLYMPLRWLAAEAWVPAYRLKQGPRDAYGLGDIVLTLRATAVSYLEGKVNGGLELPVMLPTGSTSKGLGMGQVMTMPAAWVELAPEPVLVRAQFGYGRMHGRQATQDGHHGVSGAPHSIVNPMNRSELQHSLTVALRLASNLSVHLRWFGALPIADDFGKPRQIVAAGAQVNLGWLDLTAEFQLPVVGDPFRYKIALQLGANF